MGTQRYENTNNFRSLSIDLNQPRNGLVRNQQSVGRKQSYENTIRVDGKRDQRYVNANPNPNSNFNGYSGSKENIYSSPIMGATTYDNSQKQKPVYSIPGTTQSTTGRVPIFRQAIEAYGLNPSQPQNNQPQIIRRPPTTTTTP
jgi:hypothetical protein